MHVHAYSKPSLALTSFFALSLVLPACGDDGDAQGIQGDSDTASQTDSGSEDSGEVESSGSESGDEAQSFVVTVENVSPASGFLQSGVTAIPSGESEPGPLLPGGSYEIDFFAGPGHHLSFAHMFVPSNDLFYAPDTYGIPLYDEAGSPRSGDLTAEVTLWDLGSEVNEEPGAGASQPMMQSGPNTGDDDDDDAVRPASDDFDNLPPVADVINVELLSHGDSRFTLRITNVSTAATLGGSGGDSAVPLAPGVWAVHTAHEAPLFISGQADRGDGLESLAEDGDPSGLAGVLEEMTALTGPLAPGAWALHASEATFFEDGSPDLGLGLEALAEDGDPSILAASLEGAGLTAGAFNTPLGADAPAAIFSGESYSFTIAAMPGDHLSLATMLVQSNDLFFGTGDSGLPLFDASGAPIAGDISEALELWDAGTEVNQFPGAGLDQAPRQAGPNTGADEEGSVRRVDDGFVYPAAADYLRVTLELQ
jgi:hypothetical protein